MMHDVHNPKAGEHVNTHIMPWSHRERDVTCPIHALFCTVQFEKNWWRRKGLNREEHSMAHLPPRQFHRWWRAAKAVSHVVSTHRRNYANEGKVSGRLGWKGIHVAWNSCLPRRGLWSMKHQQPPGSHLGHAKAMPGPRPAWVEHETRLIPVWSKNKYFLSLFEHYLTTFINCGLFFKFVK